MKLKFYKKYYLVMSLLLYIFAVSCSGYQPEEGGGDPNNNGGDGTTNNPRFDETYIIPDYSTTGYSVFTEYEKYFFKTNETRDIFIRGIYTKGVTNYVWFYNPSNSNKIEEIAIGKTTGAFIDSTNNYFVCPISIVTKNNISDWNGVVFYVGSKAGESTYSSLNFNIEKINEDDKREMKVYYAHLLETDILNDGIKNSVNNVFAMCNTTIIYADAVTSGGAGGNTLPEPDSVNITFTDNDIVNGFAVVAWLKSKGLVEVYEDYISDPYPYKNREYIVILNGFYDATTEGKYEDATATTICNNYDGDEYGTRYIIIWSNETPTDYETTDLGLVHDIAHEFGHARGALFPTMNRYISLLTNGDPVGNTLSHEDGHDGKHQEYCLMRYTSYMSYDALEESKKNIIFCDRHKQMLLNTNWTETENKHGY